MIVKKSDLYFSLWAYYDKLREYMDIQLQAPKQHFVKMRRSKQGMLQKLLKGEIRLV